MSTLLITFENCIKLLGCRASKFAKCKIISPLFNKLLSKCTQKSPNYLSIPAAVKLLNDERQLILPLVKSDEVFFVCYSALNDRKDFGITVSLLCWYKSAVWLASSRKQYVLYEIVCIEVKYHFVIFNVLQHLNIFQMFIYHFTHAVETISLFLNL
ncbi:hypothetical protein T11_4906 [Trichinella zimbabwensis]|uniref:Uncharacterized protein n=1 Tax=Trichinella zimbabwensis TaxID=268475 RepID=A0A0V1H2C2_9BILA|nr:hypothetical protein T11_4906 [Trichinella zimbabwensis]